MIPGVLQIAGKVRALGGKLVTTGNGAPCCCGQSDCVCDPNSTPYVFRYYPCVNNRTGTPVDVGPFRRVLVDVSFSYTLTKSTTGIPRTLAIENGGGGTYTICYLANSARIIRGQNGWYFRRTGANIPNVSIEGNEVGDRAPFIGTDANNDGQNVFYTPVGFVPSGNDLGMGTSTYIGTECNGTQDLGSEVHVYTHTDSFTNGAASFLSVIDYRQGTLHYVVREEWSMTWRRAATLDCVHDSTGLRGGDCVGCGDPSRLVIG